MPPLDINRLSSAAQPNSARDAVAQPSANQAPRHPVTGKVFALKDGSGYALQGRDGRYYRLQTHDGGGVLATVSGGYIEAALVNVTAGSVSRLRVKVDPHHAPAADMTAPPAGGDRPAQGADVAAPLAGRDDAVRAMRATHALLERHPEAALRSHAGVDAQDVLALLR